MNDKREPDGPNGTDVTLDPISKLLGFVAVMIIFSVILLIGAATLGWDAGNVLFQMGQHDYARGLITYLFAVTTIGIAIVLVLGGLLGSGPAFKERFNRGKEILSLMLGVFGTIVGFYYGSELGAHAQQGLSVTAPLLESSPVEAGGPFALRASVSGGIPPFEFEIFLGEDTDAAVEGPVRADGWIVEQLAAPETAEEESIGVLVRVSDSTKRIVEAESRIEVRPPPPAGPTE